MSTQARSGARGPTLLERAGLSILTPAVRGSHLLSAVAGSASRSVRSYFFARRENAALRRRIESLNREVFLLRAGSADTARLEELLKIRPLVPGFRLAAPLVSAERKGPYRRALLSAGSADGVLPGSPLATPEGLIGRVISASAHLSKVILVNDADCAVGARVARTGEQGVVHGHGDTLSLEYLSSLSHVVPGDLIETAGIDGIYPRGIAVGRVTEVRGGKSLFLSVRLVPSARLNALSDVLVLDPSPALEPPR